MGWAADPQGDISTSTSLSSLTPININALSGAVSATERLRGRGQPGRRPTPSAQATAAAAVPVARRRLQRRDQQHDRLQRDAGTGVKPDFTMQIPVSDSPGRPAHPADRLPEEHHAPTSGTPKSRRCRPATSSPARGLAPGQIASGIVTFNSDGSIDMTNTTLFGTPTPSTPTLTIGASSAAGRPARAQVNWAAGLGVAAQSVGVNISGTTGSGGLTQFASASSVQQVTTNGTPFGNLSSVVGRQERLCHRHLRQRHLAQDRPGRHGDVPERRRAAGGQRQRLPGHARPAAPTT